MQRSTVLILVSLVVIAGAAVFLTVAELSDNRHLPDSCNAPFSEPDIGDPPSEVPPPIAIDIIPKTSQVGQNRTTMFLVCIANPEENNQSVDPIIGLWHSGEKEDMMHAIGKDESVISTDNHVGTLPMDVQRNDRMGRYVYAGVLEPGEVVHYTIIGSNLSDTSSYTINAEAGRYPQIGQNEISLNVTCPPSCAIVVGIEAVEGFLDEYGMAILAILGTIFTILGVLVAIYDSETILSALRVWDESGSPKESGRSEEESGRSKERKS